MDTVDEFCFAHYLQRLWAAAPVHRPTLSKDGLDHIMPSATDVSMKVFAKVDLLFERAVWLLAKGPQVPVVVVGVDNTEPRLKNGLWCFLGQPLHDRFVLLICHMVMKSQAAG